MNGTPNDPQNVPSEAINVDPIDPTVIGPGLVIMSAGPTVWDDLPDGQLAYTDRTLNGIEAAEHVTVWQRREGVWHRFPWWQGWAPDEFPAVLADPVTWGIDRGWSRGLLEETQGPLHPITDLPGMLWPDSERGRLVDKIRSLNETLHSIIGYIQDATDSRELEWDVSVERLHYLKEERDGAKAELQREREDHRLTARRCDVLEIQRDEAKRALAAVETDAKSKGDDK